MSQLVTMQVTAVATVVLAAGAIVTGVFAFLAFHAQRQQLKAQLEDNARQAKVMALQADELQESLKERKRDREQRRSAQAARVFVWTGLSPEVYWGQDDVANAPGGIRNSSEQPVYGVIFIWSFGPQRASSSSIGTIMPGEQQEHSPGRVDSDLGQSLGPLSASAYFRDAAQVYWHVQADGNLREASSEEIPPEWRFKGPVETHE
jgi:hypothetical protein